MFPVPQVLYSSNFPFPPWYQWSCYLTLKFGTHHFLFFTFSLQPLLPVEGHVDSFSCRSNYQGTGFPEPRCYIPECSPHLRWAEPRKQCTWSHPQNPSMVFIVCCLHWNSGSCTVWLAELSRYFTSSQTQWFNNNATHLIWCICSHYCNSAVIWTTLRSKSN